MTEKRYELKHVLAAVGTVLIWSSAFSAVSMIVGPGGGYRPGQLVLLRFLVASATMAVIAVIRRQRLPRREDVRYHLKGKVRLGESGWMPSTLPFDSRGALSLKDIAAGRKAPF